MRRARRVISVVTAALLLSGCANVKVKKVDVEKRLSGHDTHVKGFRYYLNRPYIVVSKHLTVSSQLVPVALAEVTDNLRPVGAKSNFVFVSLTPTDGQYQVYDSEARLTSLNWQQVSFIPKAKAVAPAAAADVDDQELIARLVIARTNLEIQRQFPGRSPIDSQSTADIFLKEVHQKKDSPLIKPGPEEGFDRYRKTLRGLFTVVQAKAEEPGMPLVLRHDSIRDLASPFADKLFLDLAPPSRGGVLAQGLAVLAMAEFELDPPREYRDLDQTAKDAMINALRTAARTAKDAPTLRDVANQAVEAMKKTAAANRGATAGSATPMESAWAKVGDWLAWKIPMDKADRLLNGALTAEPTSTAPIAPSAPSNPEGLKIAPVTISGRPDTDPSQTPAAAADLSDAVKVAFLPDFEEQYAIHNKNVLARTKYDYKFRNGTQLVSMSGNYNATDVPVKIIETVGTLLEAAGAVARQKLDPTAALSGESPSFLPRDVEIQEYYIKIEECIEPGVYRVQKSWERAAAAEFQGMGREAVQEMFSEVGLPIYRVNSILTKDQAADELAAMEIRARAAGAVGKLKLDSKDQD